MVGGTLLPAGDLLYCAVIAGIAFLILFDLQEDRANDR